MTGWDWKPLTNSTCANSSRHGDRFGASLAFYGQWLVVGAPDHDREGFLSRGAAYVFSVQNETVRYLQELDAPGIDEADRFGDSVSVHFPWIAVSAYLDEF